MYCRPAASGITATLPMHRQQEGTSLTGPEHYQQAEKIIEFWSTKDPSEPNLHGAAAMAQVHATLAMTAAKLAGSSALLHADRATWPIWGTEDGGVGAEK